MAKHVKVSIPIDLLLISFYSQKDGFFLVICFSLFIAGHINLISEVESPGVQILAALIRLDTRGESDGGLKNATNALQGWVLWAPGWEVGFELWLPEAPSPKPLWTLIWIHELSEHIHCSCLLLHHRVLVSSKIWPVQQLEIHWIIEFIHYSFCAKQISLVKSQQWRCDVCCGHWPLLI